MGALYVNGELSVVAAELRFSNDGKPWAKLRLVSKERVRGADGAWTDGESTFIDGYVSGPTAEHLIESVQPGDQVIVAGRIVNKQWTTQDGEKRDGWRINISDIGVSVRFASALSERSRALGPSAPSQPQADDMFAAPVQAEAAPF